MGKVTRHVPECVVKIRTEDLELPRRIQKHKEPAQKTLGNFARLLMRPATVENSQAKVRSIIAAFFKRPKLCNLMMDKVEVEYYKRQHKESNARKQRCALKKRTQKKKDKAMQQSKERTRQKTKEPKIETQ